MSIYEAPHFMGCLLKSTYYVFSSKHWHDCFVYTNGKLHAKLNKDFMIIIFLEGEIISQIVGVKEVADQNNDSVL